MNFKIEWRKLPLENRKIKFPSLLKNNFETSRKTGNRSIHYSFLTKLGDDYHLKLQLVEKCCLLNRRKIKQRYIRMLTEEACGCKSQLGRARFSKKRFTLTSRSNTLQPGVMEWVCVLAVVASTYTDIKGNTDIRLQPHFQKRCDKWSQVRERNSALGRSSQLPTYGTWLAPSLPICANNLFREIYSKVNN